MYFLTEFVKLPQNSGEFSLLLVNKYDIYQLHVEVHGVEVYPLCYRLVSGRLVGSKKSPVALSDPVSTNVTCFAERFARI